MNSSACIFQESDQLHMVIFIVSLYKLLILILEQDVLSWVISWSVCYHQSSKQAALIHPANPRPSLDPPPKWSYNQHYNANTGYLRCQRVSGMHTMMHTNTVALHAVRQGWCFFHNHFYLGIELLELLID